MNAHECIRAGTGLVAAVLLSGLMIVMANVLGIPGHSPAPDPGRHLTYNKSVTLAAALPESPAAVPAYRVSNVKNLVFRSPITENKKAHVPSEREAPALAARGLVPYGGLPPDAVLAESRQIFWKDYPATTGNGEKKFPQYTLVLFRKQVNGFPVLGTMIDARLGEDGEILDLEDIWCTLESSGETPVIAAEEALEKLNRQDLLIPVQCCILGYTITRVEFGYYADLHPPDAANQPGSPDTCTPVWIFYGVKPGTDGAPYPLIVNATRG